MRKPDFCICENKDADQLRGNREADQRLCFRYMDSTTHILSKSEISILQPSSVAVQPGLCRTWSETPKTGFLTSWFILMFACGRNIVTFIPILSSSMILNIKVVTSSKSYINAYTCNSCCILLKLSKNLC